MKWFHKGFVLPWNGYRFLNLHPRLWRYAWVPALLALLIFFGALLGFGILASSLYDQWTVTWTTTSWWGGVLRAVLAVTLGLVTLVVSGVSASLFSLLFLDQAYGRLAYQVQKQMHPGESLPPPVPFWASLKDSVMSLAEILLVNMAIFLVGIVPGIGAPLALVAGLFFNSYFLGIEILSYPLALHGRRRREQKAFAKSHRLLVHGLGGAAMALLAIPVVGQLLLSAAVAGSTVWLSQNYPSTEKLIKSSL